jgi:hypothetical protein
VLIARRFLTQIGVARSPYELAIDIGRKPRASLMMQAIIAGASRGGLFPSAGQISTEAAGFFEGQKIADYMLELRETPDAYARQFSRYARLGIGPDDIVPMYRRAFAGICEDPGRAPPCERARYRRVHGKPGAPTGPQAE